MGFLDILKGKKPDEYERSGILPLVRNIRSKKLEAGVPSAVMDLLRAAMTPGDVYQGNTAMWGDDGRVSPEIIKRSADFASNMAVGAPAVTGAARMAAGKTAIDPNTLNIFAGPTAKTADHAAFKTAQEMAAKGASRDEIWNQTGWFKGVDGKWRFEIDDSNSMHNTELTEYGWNGKFGDALYHPELAKAYPDAQDIDTSIAWTMGRRGEYSPPDPLVKELFGTGEEIRASGLHSDLVRETLLHEAQHAIQRREGFGPGGNPHVGRELSAEPLIGDIQSLSDYINNSRRMVASAGGIGPFERDTLFMIADAERELADLKAKAAKRPQTAYDAYRQISGEVEAANVENRKNMTAAERRATPPWATQDFPDDQQIVRSR